MRWTQIMAGGGTRMWSSVYSWMQIIIAVPGCVRPTRPFLCVTVALLGGPRHSKPSWEYNSVVPLTANARLGKVSPLDNSVIAYPCTEGSNCSPAQTGWAENPLTERRSANLMTSGLVDACNRNLPCNSTLQYIHKTRRKSELSTICTVVTSKGRLMLALNRLCGLRP